MLYWIKNLGKNGIVTWLFAKFKRLLLVEKPTGHRSWWLRYFFTCFGFWNWSETPLYSVTFTFVKKVITDLIPLRRLFLTVFQWWVWEYVNLNLIHIISWPFQYVFKSVCVWRNLVFQIVRKWSLLWFLS